MADGLTVNVPDDNENENENEIQTNNNNDGNTDENGLSLGANYEEEEDDTERIRAGLNSPKGDPTLGVPATDGVDGGATPNTLRNQYDVNSPRKKKGEIPGGWGTATAGGQSADSTDDNVPSAGLQSLVTQVSRDDDTAQIMPQSNKDDDSTAQEIKNQTQGNGGFCACFSNLFCCFPNNNNQTGVTQVGSASQSVSKSKPNDPLIPPPQAPLSMQTKKTDANNNNNNNNNNSNNNENDYNNNNNNDSNNSNMEDDNSDSETMYVNPGLLPPLLPEHYGKKCLVLDLDETLVHSSFKPIPNPDFVIPVEIDNVVHRVYVMKRPYVDEFLIETAKDYEIVIFTASLAKYADPLLDKLDPHNTITHRLFRESCVLHGTAYVKDLRTLGRKLKNSIIVDNSPPSYLFQPGNAVPILSWFDDQTDTQLRDLLPCLQTTLKNIKDVRWVLDANSKSYRWLCQQANNPLEMYSPQ